MANPTCYFQCDNCNATTTASTSDVKAVGHPMCPDCVDREMGEITYKEYRAVQKENKKIEEAKKLLEDHGYTVTA